MIAKCARALPAGTVRLLFGALVAAAGADGLGDEGTIFRDRQIVVPEFTVRDMPLDQVLPALEEASVRADVEGVGIRIVNLTKEPLRSHRVTISVRNRSVRSIAELLGSMLALWIRSDGDTLEVRPSERILRAQPPGGRQD